jgi:hypothetical protein
MNLSRLIKTKYGAEEYDTASNTTQQPLLGYAFVVGCANVTQFSQTDDDLLMSIDIKQMVYCMKCLHGRKRT